MMGDVEDGEEEASQLSYKLVPWFAWDEWNFVRNSIFTSSPTSLSAALARITTWRSRGCLPCPVEVTASLVEAQQRDPFFRPDLPADCANSDEMLAMTYCMAIMRLVNGFVEKTRKKNGPSISQSAERIGIPRMLVDIRHECSHRQLPSLALSRMASTVALDWLKVYYWEPQRKAIPNIKKEVKFKLREMASYLNSEQTQNEDPSLTKRKRSKRQISTITKSITRLFEGRPSDVVAVLVERFQKITRKSGIMKSKEDSCSSLADTGQAGENSGKFDVWKAIVVRLSKKEPALRLAVIESLIKMVEDQSTWKSEQDECSVQHLPGAHQDDIHSLLIKHLLEMMKAVKFSDANGCDQSVLSSALNKTRLWQLLSKCLLVSPGNKHLISCAIILGQIIGEDFVVEKLEKLLPVLRLPGPDSVLQDAGFTEAMSIFQHHKDSLNRSSKQLENLKQCQSRTSLCPGNIVGETQTKTWKVSKSWSPAPIGMLPYPFGPGETLPIIVKAENLEKVTFSSQDGLDPKRTQILGKREPSCDAEQLKSVCSGKKIRDECSTPLLVNVDNSNLQSLEGHLMIAGYWKKLEEDQLLELESRVKILV